MKPGGFGRRGVLAGTFVVAVSVAGQSTGLAAGDGALSHALGLFVYAREGPRAASQAQDEAECFSWARAQTGIDPLGPEGAQAESPAAAAVPENRDASGSMAKSAVAGAAGGAVAGTAIGAVAGDTGKGAAVGATAGLLQRARQARLAGKESERRAEAEGALRAQAATQAQAVSQRQRETFSRAFCACMEGRNYAVR